MEFKFLLELVLGVIIMSFNFYLFLEGAAIVTLLIAIVVAIVLFWLAYQEDVKNSKKGWYSKEYIEKHKVIKK